MLASPRKNVPQPLLILSFTGLVCVVFFGILLRLYFVQIKQGAEFKRRSLGNFVQTKRVKHSRGEIVDRYGRVLVGNRASFDVVVTPAFLPNTRRNIMRLAQTANVPKDEASEIAVAFWRTLQESGPPIMLGRDLTAEDAKRLRQRQRGLDIPLEAIVIIPAKTESGEEKRYAAYLDPVHFPSVTRVLRRVADLVGLDEKAFQRSLRLATRQRGLARYRDLMIRSDVSAAVAAQLTLEIEIGDLPGISVPESQTRDYGRGDVAAHLIGYVNELSSAEYEAKKGIGYYLGDVIGRRGIERTFEAQLRGSDGLKTSVVDSKGRAQNSRWANALIDEVGLQERAQSGSKVVLSINLELQAVAEKAFAGLAGAVIALEAKTGRILTLTSTPAFRPDQVSPHFDRRERSRLHALRSFRPWRFRAIQDHYAPGSTFKPFTALAALRKKATYASEKFQCKGAFRMGDTKFRCWKQRGHGHLAMVDSLAQSCDVYFYSLADRMGLNPIAEMATEFGLGQKTGVDLPGETSGIIPDEAWYNKRYREGYTRGAAVNVSIGQGAVAVTPLQLAVAYAALANGGRLFRPQLVLRIEETETGEVQSFEPELVRKISVPKRHLDLVKKGLRKVVNDRTGTAYSRRLKELIVSGKTGTAQVARLGSKRLKTKDMKWKVRDHAWFAAYAPADDPEIVVVVLNEHGGHGGSAAAPAAMKLIRAWWQLKQIRAGLDKDAPLNVIGEEG